MVRLFLTVLTTVVFVAFALSNTNPVPFSFVVGETQVRLILLLLVAFAGGVLTILVNTALKDARDRALTNTMRASMTKHELLRDEIE
jgi:uncharacterized integral membrane protein